MYGLLRGGVSAISLSSTSSEDMAGFSVEKSLSVIKEWSRFVCNGVSGRCESVSGVDVEDRMLSVSL
jgi:hypothetical protein